MSRRTSAVVRRLPVEPQAFAALQAPLLVAVTCIPAFFNIQSSTSFEPDKSALMHTLAFIALIPLIRDGMQQGRSQGFRRLWAALSLPWKLLAAIGVAAVLATVLGVDPVSSFWGNHERGYGLLTLLAQIVLMAAAAQLAARGHAWLLIDAVLLAGAIPVLYGLLQVAGHDPVRGSTVSFVLGERASSSLGNPLYLADFLLLGFLLLLARVMVGPALGRSARVLLLIYGCLWALAMLATSSRGAFFGVLAAGAFLGLYWAAILAKNSPNRWAPRLGWLLGLGALTAGITVMVLAWVAPDLLPARLRDLFASGGTGGQRLLIWQAVFDLLAAQPRYLLTGLGLDALPLALAPYLPAQLAHYEVDWVFRLPDRAHTWPLDLLSQQGVLGLGLWTLFWTALCLRLLPLSRHAPGWRPAVAALAPLGGAVGLAAAAGLLAGPTAMPLAYTFGLLAGVLILILMATRSSPSAAPSLLAPYLLAALAGRWLLLGVSFPTHAPDLLLAVVVGLALAPGPARPALTAGSASGSGGPSPVKRKPAGVAATGGSPAVAAMGAAPVAALVWPLAGGAAAVFGFSLSAAWPASLPLWLLAAALLLLLAGALDQRGWDVRTWVQFLLLVATLLPAILLDRFLGLRAWAAYTWLLLWLGGFCWWLSTGAGLPPIRAERDWGWLALSLPVILALNAPVYGDIAFKSAILSPSDSVARQTFMERAFLLSPYDHILAFGIAPTEAQAVPPGATLADPQARRVVELYQQAMAAEPRAPEPVAAYAEWLRQLAPVDAQAAKLAETMFARALERSPNDIQTRLRLALLRGQMGEPAASQADLLDLLALDPLYGPAYLHLAALQQQQGDSAAARATLARGIENVPWWPELAGALRRLDAGMP